MKWIGNTVQGFGLVSVLAVLGMASPDNHATGQLDEATSTQSSIAPEGGLLLREVQGLQDLAVVIPFELTDRLNMMSPLGLFIEQLRIPMGVP